MFQLTELEGELAELRGAYEQYFMGNERVPPLKKHDAFKKFYLKLKASSVRQTAVKFRLETLGQKLLTYERLWDRTLKEIENGTYKRDLLRAKRIMKSGSESKKDADFDVDEDLDLSDLDESDDLASVIAAAEKSVTAPAVKPVTGVAPAIAPMVPSGLTPAGGTRLPSVAPVVPAGSTPASGTRLPSVAPMVPTGSTPASGTRLPTTTPAPGVSGLKPVTNPFAQAAAPAGPPKITSGAFPAVARPTVTTPPQAKAAAPPRAAGDGGLSDSKIKAIYDAYVMAKKRCGEDTRAVTLDSVASSLKKQVPELMKQHNAKSVEFKVVIKDGKAILRALPKDS